MATTNTAQAEPITEDQVLHRLTRLTTGSRCSINQALHYSGVTLVRHDDQDDDSLLRTPLQALGND